MGPPQQDPRCCRRLAWLDLRSPNVAPEGGSPEHGALAPPPGRRCRGAWPCDLKCPGCSPSSFLPRLQRHGNRVQCLNELESTTTTENPEMVENDADMKIRRYKRSIDGSKTESKTEIGFAPLKQSLPPLHHKSGNDGHFSDEQRRQTCFSSKKLKRAVSSFC